MAWHHSTCFEEIKHCAACSSTGESSILPLITPIENADTKLANLIKRSQLRQVAPQSCKHLIAELRFLEKFLIERLKVLGLTTLIRPYFEGFYFNSSVKPPRFMKNSESQNFGYIISLERTHQFLENAIQIEQVLQTKNLTLHYRSLHAVEHILTPDQRDVFRKKNHYDIIQVQYFAVQDEQDPFNSGKNSRVIAYSEKDIHFLIQLLYDLLLNNKIS